MNFSPDNETARGSIPQDYRCVWMTAGILSYQLCEREFDCEHCPLDNAMRMHFTRHVETVEEKTPKNDVDSPEFRENDYQYSQNHFWIKNLENGTLRLGLSPTLTRVLHTLKTLILPSRGDHLSPDRYCCWLVMEGGTLPFYSPISGVISSTNTVLTDEPHLLHLKPFTDGWLFNVEKNQRTQHPTHLMSHVVYRKYFASTLERFQTFLRDELKSSIPQNVMTLADGGEFLNDVSAMIGPKRYFEILKKAFVIE